MSNLILTIEAQGEVAYEFALRSITIGRAPDNRIIIDDPSVSNRYAMLEPSGKSIDSKISNRPTAPKSAAFQSLTPCCISKTGFDSEQ